MSSSHLGFLYTTPPMSPTHKSQTKTQTDSIIVGSFIVFKEDSTEPFSGLQLQIEFPNSLVELDTILPGLFLTDTSQSTPLFTYTYSGNNLVDIYAYFLGTTKLDIDGTGHLADLIFSSSVVASRQTDSDKTSPTASNGSP